MYRPHRKASLQQPHIVEAGFGNVDVDVTHLHVDPQALHHRQTVLVIPQVLQAHDSITTCHETVSEFLSNTVNHS